MTHAPLRCSISLIRGRDHMEPAIIIEHGTDWAVVLATLVGPVVAVAISLWNEDRRARRKQREWIFSTLMATRALPAHFDHVRALNTVFVEFRNYPKVVEAWKSYLDRLPAPAAGVDADRYFAERGDRLMELLIAIGIAVGHRNLKLADLKYGAYSPQGWVDDAERGRAAMQVLADVHAGKPFPIEVRQPQ